MYGSVPARRQPAGRASGGFDAVLLQQRVDARRSAAECDISVVNVAAAADLEDVLLGAVAYGIVREALD